MLEHVLMDTYEGKKQRMYQLNFHLDDNNGHSDPLMKLAGQILSDLVASIGNCQLAIPGQSMYT